MHPSPRRCPASSSPVCPERPACPADPAAVLPRDGVERVVMLALRFVAAAAETGDAACFDAAFEGAEAAFGPRDGALLVGRAAALVRALRRDEAELRFLPPPCRRLSPGEAGLLAALRRRLSDGRPPAEAGLSGATRAALADLGEVAWDGPLHLARPCPAAPVRSAALGLPMATPAGPTARVTV